MPPEEETPSGSLGTQSAAASPSSATSQTPDDASSLIPEINLVARPDLDKRPILIEDFGGASSGTPGDTFEERPYNPDVFRDVTRQTITLWLIGLFCTIVVLTFVALFARGASTGFTNKDFFSELKQILDVLVGPVITLLASAIGFYFGYKQGELSDQGRNGRPGT